MTESKYILEKMSGEISIITRGRGEVLLLNGYEYYHHVTYRDNSSLWRCANYKKTKCGGTVKIDQVSFPIFLVYIFCQYLNRPDF